MLKKLIEEYLYGGLPDSKHSEETVQILQNFLNWVERTPHIVQD